MIKYLAAASLYLLLAACASTDYVGESYAPTTNVDVFFDAAEIKRSYTTMGTAKTEGSEYMSFEVIEQQLVQDAMAKGADAILIEGMDTITVGSTTYSSGDSEGGPRYVVTEKGKLKNVGGDGHYSAIATTTDIKDKVISARLLKYD